MLLNLPMTLIQSDGADIATYEVGAQEPATDAVEAQEPALKREGSPIIFLHGGPGDTHDYMKRMAQPFFKDFQCVFFDQRGSGNSPVQKRQADQFTLELLLKDLKAVKEFYSSGPVKLVGHSWGAMYALYAAMESPQDFSKIVLLNMGPLDDEYGKLSAEKLISIFSEAERYTWAQLRLQRNQARDQNDVKKVIELDEQMMRLRVKSWIFNPSLHEEFLAEYFLDPAPDREVNKWIWENLSGTFNFEKLKSVMAKTLIVAGAEDAVPIDQFIKINKLILDSQLEIFEQCGHIPWLEHPSRFYSLVSSFLK